MNITHEQRLVMLDMYNKLRNITQTIHECNDIWTSQVGELERLEHELQSIFKFTAQRDSDGKGMWYRDWVLEDLSVDPDGEQPDV
jgi:hypothetical protein